MMYKKWTGKQRGFTLIEVILVISIIGILAAVAVPFYSDVVTQAYRAQALGVSSEIRAGIILKYVKCVSDPLLPDVYTAQLDAAANGICDLANPCFGEVLNQSIVDSSWSKTSADVYAHINSGVVCTYNSDEGSSTWGQWTCVN